MVEAADCGAGWCAGRPLRRLGGCVGSCRDDDLKLRLRRKLLFKSRRMYYSVMAVNLVLRFLWALTLLPESRSSFLGSELQVRCIARQPLAHTQQTAPPFFSTVCC